MPDRGDAILVLPYAAAGAGLLVTAALASARWHGWSNRVIGCGLGLTATAMVVMGFLSGWPPMPPGGWRDFDNLARAVATPIGVGLVVTALVAALVEWRGGDRAPSEDVPSILVDDTT
jgi:hypothetical protein